MTNFDTDTRFQADYIPILKTAIMKSKNKYSTVWQPLLYYNWDLQYRSVFVRITSIVRNMLMLGGLVPFQINVMSVFSFSLRLCIDGGYTHPAYQMDDIICYIRWFALTKRRVSIQPLYSATLSGPTSGENLREEIAEWARQLRRWTIGSAEVFHYYCVKIGRIRPRF